MLDEHKLYEEARTYLRELLDSNDDPLARLAVLNDLNKNANKHPQPFKQLIIMIIQGRGLYTGPIGATPLLERLQIMNRKARENNLI